MNNEEASDEILCKTCKMYYCMCRKESFKEWGSVVSKRRIELGYSLRKFCLENGYDCGNWSKVERGLLLPFDKDSVAHEKLIKALKLDFLEGERLKELSEMKRQPLYRDNLELQEKIDQLEQDKRRLLECVGFYVKEDTCVILHDEGNRAKAVLKDLGEE